MKTICALLLAVLLFTCNLTTNNGNTNKDSVAAEAHTDTLKRLPVKGFRPTTKEEYGYVSSIKTIKDSIFLMVDYVQFLTGDSAVAAAKQRGGADTVYDSRGKIKEIMVDDDYYIVNDSKLLRRFYLPPTTVISMDSTLAGEGAKNINSFAYLNDHSKNYLFLFSIVDAQILTIKQIYLP